jgi:hypothetical protein
MTIKKYIFIFSDIADCPLGKVSPPINYPCGVRDVVQRTRVKQLFFVMIPEALKIKSM